MAAGNRKGLSEEELDVSVRDLCRQTKDSRQIILPGKRKCCCFRLYPLVETNYMNRKAKFYLKGSIIIKLYPFSLKHGIYEKKFSAFEKSVKRTAPTLIK